MKQNKIKKKLENRSIQQSDIAPLSGTLSYLDILFLKQTTGQDGGIMWGSD